MWTTSRYSSDETRRLCRKLADSSRSIYVARGKKTISELVGFARRKGEHSIMIVEEKEGGPAEIKEITVFETGSWQWQKSHGIDGYGDKRKIKSGV